MPVLVETTDTFIAPPHKLWTREECAGLERAGILDLERYELIEGELLLKMSKKSPHLRTVWLLTRWLRSTFGEQFVAQEPAISVHPEDSQRSEPEPDAIVLNRPFPDLESLARPEDLRLVAEVSGVTFSFDMTVKARLYARAGIAEYLVVDLHGRRVIVHRRPEGGQYLDVVAYLADEMVAALGAPGDAIRVGDLF